MTSRFRNGAIGALLEKLPADIALVIVVSLLTAALLLAPAAGHRLVRLALGILVFTFFPGYAIVAALFPEKGGSLSPANRDPEGEGEGEPGPTFRYRSIDPLERLAFSVGVSIVVVPLVGFLLHAVLSVLSPFSVILSLTALTVVTAVIAGWRRAALPVKKRFSVPYKHWIHVVSRPDSRAEAVLNMVVLLSIVLLISSFVYATTVPKETFTEFYLLSEDGSGQVAADSYPQNLTRGQSASLYVGIGNEEGTDMAYTVVVQLQRVAPADERVLNSEELSRFEVDVPRGEARQVRHTVTPPTTGENLRLMYLLYIGEAPTDPDPEDAYRRIHIWIDISA